MSIPQRYVPKSLSRKDSKKQLRNILKSRNAYDRGIYFQRPKVKSFHSKPSKHVLNARKTYKIENIRPTQELSEKTGCSLPALKSIVNKGEGAYYSSGSRPNQTAESWGYARLASAITGQNASVVDYHILEKGCKKNSLALKLANRLRKTCKNKKKCLRSSQKYKKK